MNKIALLGCGTIGKGVIELISSNKDRNIKVKNEELKLSKILVRAPGKYKESEYRTIITDNFDDVMKEDLDIVVEVMGGVHPAYEYVKRALESKKHVVTANKDLIAEHGAGLLDIACVNGVELRFEASVGGGIPIIKSIRHCVAGNKISGLKAILNGTTNFILTKMNDEGMQYEEAVRVAQRLGFAESDPTSDVLGLDAARKLSILSTIAFKEKVDWKKVVARGINNLDCNDFKLAKYAGCSIKLLAISKVLDGRIYASVAPVMVKTNSHLGRINNEYNAILVEGDAVGDVMLSGKGAGMLPTASAILGDIADIIHNEKKVPMTFDYDTAKIHSLWGEESSWLLRIKSNSNWDVIKKLREKFSSCRILTESFEFANEISCLVKVETEEHLDQFMAELRVNSLINSYKKIMILGD